MNRGVYTAAMGMSASQRWMDVAANNLANVSTDGFKADGLEFSDVMVREMHSGGRTLGTLGSGPGTPREYTNLNPGQLRPTGNPLDVALSDSKSMIAVRDGNTTRFTRGGSFSLDGDGALVTIGGAKVLDRSGNEIRLDRKSPVLIDPTGAIHQNNRVVAELAVVEGRFTKEGNNLWGGTGVRPGNATVTARALESSNVNALEGMIDMIQIGRHVDMAQRAMNTHDESTGKLLGILGR